MRILMVHPHEVSSRLEPWTTRIVNLGKGLMRKGHEIRIVHFPLEWKGNSESFQKEGIKCFSFCRKAGVLNILKNCSRFLELADWAEIVHFQKCFHYASLPSVTSSFFKCKPLHYDWDDWEEMIYYESADPPLKMVGWFLRILEKQLPHIVDTVSVSSQTLRNLCLKSGIPADRIFHVPVGADLGKFNPGIPGDRIKKTYNISNPLVLYIGQLHGGQYVNLFIQAAKIILSAGIKADFMIVGDGVRMRELKQLAKNLNLNKKIIFTGAVNAEEIPEYIRDCDVAVACFEDNPVTRCKSPLKIVEYMACGKAIVASNVGEVERMIGDAGILVQGGMAVPLAEKIMFLISRPDLREELGIRARKRAEDVYNWEVSSDVLQKAYETALRNRQC